MKPGDAAKGRTNQLFLALALCVLSVFFLLGGISFLLPYFIPDAGFPVGTAVLICFVSAAVCFYFVWRLLRDRKYLPEAPVMTATSQAACAECKGVFNIRDMISHNGVYMCASCKPIFLQKLAEGANQSVEKRSFRSLEFWIFAIALGTLILLMVWSELRHRRIY